MRTNTHAIELPDVKQKLLVEPVSVEPSSNLSLTDQTISTSLSQWLNTLDITTEDLEQQGLSLNTLQTLWNIESSHWGTWRWINIDHFLEKLLHYLVLRQSDLHFNDELTSDTHDPHLWLEGRGLPLKTQRALRSAYAVSGFRQGSEFILTRGTHLTLYTVLLYQVVQSSQLGNITSFQTFFKVFWNSQETAFTSLFYFHQV